MKPIETETTNAVYTLEGCNDLPVTKYTNVDNKEEGVESCWQLTPEEIETVTKTGKIYLTGKNWPRLYEIRIVEKR